MDGCWVEVVVLEIPQGGTGGTRNGTAVQADGPNAGTEDYCAGNPRSLDIYRLELVVEEEEIANDGTGTFGGNGGSGIVLVRYQIGEYNSNRKSNWWFC